MTTVKLKYATLGEFRDAAMLRTPEGWGQTPEEGGSRNIGNMSFSGTRTFGDAVDLARHGWAEGRAKMFRELSNMKTIAKNGRLATWTHDVAGFLPDVPRAVAGMPDCMFNRGEESNRAKPVIKIVANLGRHAQIYSESINWFGAAILTWLDYLEAQGYACELTAVMFSRAGMSNEAQVTVDLKQAGEPLDLDRMAFCLVNPAFHRRFKFAVMENEDKLKPHAGTYGRSQEISQEQRDELEATVYVYKISDNFSNARHAWETVSEHFNNHLAKAGIKLNEEG